jgi:hypothetical protein
LLSDNRGYPTPYYEDLILKDSQDLSSVILEKINESISDNLIYKLFGFYISEKGASFSSNGINDLVLIEEFRKSLDIGFSILNENLIYGAEIFSKPLLKSEYENALLSYLDWLQKRSKNFSNIEKNIYNNRLSEAKNRFGKK